MTTLRAASLRTSAVRSISIVTGSGPQSKVIIPPLPTARRNAFAVQLSRRPVADDLRVERGALRLPRRTTARA